MIFVFAVAQLLDIGSALQIPVKYESNLVMRMLLDQPAAAVAAKISLIVLGIAVATIIARTRPGLAATVYAVGTTAGIVGLLSNMAVIRALS